MLLNKVLAWLLLFFIASYTLNAQILPKEGGRLNYRLIGFSFAKEKDNASYKIEISYGSYYTEDTFSKNIILSIPCDTDKMIIKVPAFGREYTWRVVSTNPKTGIRKSELHHFSTSTNIYVDTNNMRLRILKPAEKYKDAYVFVEWTKALYDMSGRPVWFLPAINEKPAQKIWGFGDLDFTQQGTLTYVTTPKGGQVYETDFNGKLLWQGPNTGKVSGDTIEYYHHDFTRLPNGHYMALGEEPVSWALPSSVDTAFLNNPANKNKIRKDKGKYYQNLHFGTIIEYDTKGKVVWSWKSSGYFKRSDVYDHTGAMGTFDMEDVHENSFYFDEKEQVIYIGFKEISRIIKIKYPEGTILNVYGKTFKPNNPGYDNPLFYHQHCVRRSDNGYLYLYNNNNHNKGSLPTIEILQEPHAANGALKTIWEYECPIDGFDTSQKELPEFGSLGSVFELPDRSILACMTDKNYTRLFIVDHDKHVLWSAMPERRNAEQNKWYPLLQYRANIIIDHKDIERLIWNAEMPKLNDK